MPGMMKLEGKKRVFALVLSSVILVGLIFIADKIFLQKDAPLDRTGEPPRPDQIIRPAAPPFREYRETIPRGGTLAEILSGYGLTPAEVHDLKEKTKPVYNLDRIVAGRELRLFADEDGRIVRVEYDLDAGKSLKVTRGGGKVKAEVEEIPVEVRTEVLIGNTQGTILASLANLGESAALALAFAELFAWDVDFNTDQRPEDTFSVVFEKRYLNGNFVGYGPILAAAFANQGKTFQAFRYVYPDTKKYDYFDPEGNSLRKEFLKSPLGYARITSRFSQRRFHPIRKVVRPHYGVDYAAPTGTPTQATADGEVTFTGWNGASGRMVSVRHKNGYETMYLHLRGFGPGIKKGAKVVSGQVLGYIGSSGESTGPHLDYRIKLRGRYINPLSRRFNPVEPIRKEYLEDFKDQSKKYSLLLDYPVYILSYLSFL